VKHTHKIGRNPLEEGTVIGRGLYLYNTQYPQHTDIHAPVGFEPAIPASMQQQQTCTLNSAVTGTGLFLRSRDEMFLHPGTSRSKHLVTWRCIAEDWNPETVIVTELILIPLF